MNIIGKAAVVTGGASGIGFGIAQALLEKGCRVMIADIEEAKVLAAAEMLNKLGGDVRTQVCNVADYASVTQLADAAWEAFGEINLVFNNAGVGTSGNIIDTDPKEVDWVLDVNLKGVWNGCSVFGKRFVAQEGNSVICNTASEHALGVPHLGQGIYTASKHALLGMSDVMRGELPEHVSVSVVCPGLVKTELHIASRNGPSGMPPEDVAAIGEQVLARGMDPLDIGHLTVAGVERGDFLIMTHPHARAFAEKRWQDIEEGFAKAPEVENAEQYDVTSVIQSVLSN